MVVGSVAIDDRSCGRFSF